MYLVSITTPDNQSELEGYTDNEGYIEFSDIVNGIYTFHAEKEGFTPKVMSLNISDNVTMERSITLQPESSEEGENRNRTVPGPIIPDVANLPPPIFTINPLDYITIAVVLINSILIVNNVLRSRTLPSWKKFSYSHIETGEDIQVGEWSDEYHGTQRIISFKPIRPFLEEESGLMDWLEAHLSEYGVVTISEKGEIKITCSDEVRPDRLLEQVGWVFYTLQMRAY